MMRLQERVEYIFIAITPTPLWPEIVVTVRVPSMGEIDLFKDHSYSKGMYVTPILKKTLNSWRNPHGAVANVLDYDIVVSKFELKSHYYANFRINTLGKCTNSLILFTQPLRSGRIWHKVNFLSGV